MPRDLTQELGHDVALSSLSVGMEIVVGHQDQMNRFVEEFRQPAHSIVQQFPICLAFCLNNMAAPSGATNPTDTGNTTRALTSVMSNVPFRCDAALGDVTNGIVVGTGINAVAMTDYALQTPIAHGNGAGQLAYSGMVFAAVGTSGSNRVIDVTRIATNNSGGNISITEIALYITFVYTGPTNGFFCACRDLLSVTVTNGGSKTLKYRFTVALT